LLPHRWCQMDPFAYDVWLRWQPPLYELVFTSRDLAPQLFAPDTRPWFGHWPDDSQIPKTAICHAVPYELAELLTVYLGPEHSSRLIDSNFVEGAIPTLEDLRELIEIHETATSTMPVDRATGGQHGSGLQDSCDDSEVHVSTLDKTGTLLKIPDNAVQLIDEAISLIRAAKADADEDEAATTENNSDDYPYKPCFDLADSLDIFPHKWAQFDPLIWDCWLHEDSSDFGLVFTLRGQAPISIGARASVPCFDIWPVGIPLPDKTGRLVIPSELGKLLALSRTESGIQWMSEAALDIAEAWALDLRRKLMARNELMAKPGSRSKGEDTPAILEHEVPRLTDSGRTIICAKGKFTFTKVQRPVIKIFWDNFQQENEYLREQDVLENESVNLPNSSFASLFKSRKEQFKAIFERHESEKDLWRLKLD